MNEKNELTMKISL